MSFRKQTISAFEICRGDQKLIFITAKQDGKGCANPSEGWLDDYVLPQYNYT